MSDRSGPDRNNPKWAKPLASLPEWLASVDELLQSIQESSGQYDQDSFRNQALSNVGTWQPGPRWWALWRERFGLTEAQAAEIIGNDGLPSKGIKKRMRELAEERWGEPIPDKIAWLRAWRKRLAIPQWKAANMLGYAHRCAISRIECGHSIPSWEKILIAIHAEQQLLSETLSPEQRPANSPRRAIGECGWRRGMTVLQSRQRSV